MADLGAIGFTKFAAQRHVRGGVISGTVTASGGLPAAARVVSILDRTACGEGAIPIFDRTLTRADGSYTFAGLDASFSAGPRQYLVLCLEDAAGYPSLLHDKVTPV